jgi:2,4-dienoyl-CoA reductase-like NADH-dependent reductase (Old Yellow Enzyme family)
MASASPGLVVIEATGVERIGRISHGCLGLYSDASVRAMAHVISFAKSVAPHVKFGVQLGHAGRKASSPTPGQGHGQIMPEAGGWHVVAPSPIPYDKNWQVPIELDEAGIQRIITAFRDAAVRAVAAGVDSIELHLAHGYLLQSFVSPLSNKRSDQWGGDLAGRMAMPLAVVKAVQSAIPAHIAFGARINGTDWHAEGLTPDDAVAQAAMLHAAGLHFICVSSGGASPDAKVAQLDHRHAPLARDKRVLRLDVPVPDVHGVEVAQRLEELPHQRLHLGRAQLQGTMCGRGGRASQTSGCNGVELASAVERGAGRGSAGGGEECRTRLATEVEQIAAVCKLQRDVQVDGKVDQLAANHAALHAATGR